MNVCWPLLQKPLALKSNLAESVFTDPLSRCSFVGGWRGGSISTSLHSFFHKFASKSLISLCLMIIRPPRLQFIACVISNLWPQTYLLVNYFEWLKRSAKASLNSPFDKLNPCSARGIALSQLDVPTVLVCLITCLLDTG